MTRRLAIGLACLANAGVIVWLYTHSGAATLVAIVIVLVCLPPSYDPAIIWKEARLRAAGEWNPVPKCYGQFPHGYPQDIAERCCDDCPHLVHCYSIAKGKTDGPT